jgi:hypothetical protein
LDLLAIVVNGQAFFNIGRWVVLELEGGDEVDDGEIHGLQSPNSSNNQSAFFDISLEDMLTVQYHCNLLAVILIENIIHEGCFSGTQVSF